MPLQLERLVGCFFPFFFFFFFLAAHGSKVGIGFGETCGRLRCGLKIGSLAEPVLYNSLYRGVWSHSWNLSFFELPQKVFTIPAEEFARSWGDGDCIVSSGVVVGSHLAATLISGIRVLRWLCVKTDMQHRRAMWHWNRVVVEWDDQWDWRWVWDHRRHLMEWLSNRF